MLIYTRILMVLQIISSLMSLGIAIFLVSQGHAVVGIIAAIFPLFFIWLAYSNYADATQCVEARAPHKE